MEDICQEENPPAGEPNIRFLPSQRCSRKSFRHEGQFLQMEETQGIPGVSCIRYLAEGCPVDFMYTDLVSPSGIQEEGNERPVSSTVKYLIMGDGSFKIPTRR